MEFRGATGKPPLIFKATLTLLISAVAASSQAQQIAVTIDDLPAHGRLPAGITRIEIAEQVTKALAGAGVPPTYGFVNGMRVAQSPADAAVLNIWRKSGNLLASHTWSHINLNQHTAQEFAADVAKNEPLLSQQMAGADWHWLRYPYLAEGDTPEKRSEARSGLALNHYRIAAVTMSFGDYLWNEPYARCVAKHNGNAIASLERSYLAAAQEEAQYELYLSKTLYGRSIPFVLLIHIGAFDARMLPRLLASYRDMGFTFVSLETAEKDPFYRSDAKLLDQAGPANLSAAAGDMAVPPAPRLPEDSLNTICR